MPDPLVTGQITVRPVGDISGVLPLTHKELPLEELWKRDIIIFYHDAYTSSTFTQTPASFLRITFNILYE